MTTTCPTAYPLNIHPVDELLRAIGRKVANTLRARRALTYYLEQATDGHKTVGALADEARATAARISRLERSRR